MQADRNFSRARPAGRGRRELAFPPRACPSMRAEAADQRWTETTVLNSHAVHGDVTPLLVTRKRTEWYISSLSSPQASASGSVLVTDLSTVVVPLKVTL